ncbi:MAG TPA: hypothetical protein VGG49_02745, partial [Steroidobacteraceae bacterium]
AGAALQGASVRTSLLLATYAAGAATSLALALLVGGSRLPSFFVCLGLVPIRPDSLPDRGILWDEFASWTSDRRSCGMVDG